MGNLDDAKVLEEEAAKADVVIRASPKIIYKAPLHVTCAFVALRESGKVRIDY